MRARRALLALAAAVLVLPAAAAERTPKPQLEPARGGTCVAPPEVMRREHPDMLRHQRDETVHAGVRGARASLKGCIECHAGAKSGSAAAAPGDFCVACHSYAAVKIDCFECHAARPKAAQLGSAR